MHITTLPGWEVIKPENLVCKKYLQTLERQRTIKSHLLLGVKFSAETINIDRDEIRMQWIVYQVFRCFVKY